MSGKSDYCTSCLFPDNFCMTFSCGHKACESCAFLSLLSQEKKEDIEFYMDNPEAKAFSGGRFMNCFLCSKGTSKVLVSEYVNKRVNRPDRANNAQKCEGCDTNECNPGDGQTSYCVQCKMYMCPKCEEMHESIKVFNNHLVSKIYTHTSFLAPECKCELENKLRFFCRTCSLHMCAECLILQHVEHDFSSIKPKEAFDESFQSTRSEYGYKGFIRSLRNSMAASSNGSIFGIKLNSSSTTNSRKMTVKHSESGILKDLNKQPELFLKNFKPRGSKIFSFNKSPFKSINRDEVGGTKKIEIDKILKEILFNLNLDPTQELPGTFYPTNDQTSNILGKFMRQIEEGKHKSIAENNERCDSEENQPYGEFELGSARAENEALIYMNDNKTEGSPMKMKTIDSSGYRDVNKNKNSTHRFSKIKDEGTLVKPLYNLEKSCAEKLKKNLNNLCILLEFINSIVEDIGYVYDKRSLQNIDKLITSFKELKQYLKKLKMHIDNTKCFSVVQIQLLERNIYEAIKKGKEKEKALTKIALREIITEFTEQALITKPGSATNRQYKKDNEKCYRVFYSEANCGQKADIMNLQQPTELVSMNEMSTASLPNLMALFYTEEKQLFIFWINSIGHTIEGVQIYHSNNNDMDDLIGGGIDRKRSKDRLVTEEKHRNFSLKGHKGSINSLKTFIRITTHEYYLVSCSSEGSCRIWKLDQNNRMFMYRVFEFYGINVFSSALIIPFQQEDNLPKKFPILIVSTYKKNYPIQVFDTDNGQCLKELPIKGNCYYIDIIDVSKEGDMISSVFKDKTLLLASILSITYELYVYDYSSYKIIHKIKLDSYLNAALYFERQGIGSLIINDRNGIILLIDLEKGKITKKSNLSGYFSISKFDNDLFLSCGKSSALAVHNSNTLDQLKIYSELHKEPIRNIDVSPYPGRGLCIFTYSEAKSIKCWNSPANEAATR